MYLIFPTQAADRPDIEALLDAGFGPARHNRTAYRLRDGASPDLATSFIARDGATLVGSVQCWRIRLRAADGRMVPMHLLGPVVTSSAHRGIGIASKLIETALAAIDGVRARPVLLVGDASFYGRFGFDDSATGGWIMPGPIEQPRLLLRWSGAPLPPMGWVEGENGLRQAA